MIEERNYYRRSRQEVAEFLPSNYSTVLEIGCAEGNFRYNLQDDCEYWGVESESHAAEEASSRLDNVLSGTFGQIYGDLPDNYFDLIVCNDVIEHLADHDEFLTSIKSKMKDHGYIIGSIPNFRYIKNLYELLIKKDFEYKEAGILDKTHLRFFTQKSLERAFIQNGYGIELLKGLKAHNDPAESAISRLLKQVVMKSTAMILGGDIQHYQYGFRIKI